MLDFSNLLSCHPSNKTHAAAVLHAGADVGPGNARLVSAGTAFPSADAGEMSWDLVMQGVGTGEILFYQSAAVEWLSYGTPVSGNIMHALWLSYGNGIHCSDFDGRPLPGRTNLGCMERSGVSEAVLPTQLCSGCRGVRCCCIRCQSEAWHTGGHASVCASVAWQPLSLYI